MEEDKLTSMKKVMEYQDAIDNFPESQMKLKQDI